MHAVTVSRLDPSNSHFYYDGASTWQGGWGAALLFEEGCVVGMHQEVCGDDKPEVSPPAGGGTGGASKRGRDQLQLEECIERLSVASSSQAKMCRALMLSVVRDAVELLSA